MKKGIKNLRPLSLSGAAVPRLANTPWEDCTIVYGQGKEGGGWGGGRRGQKRPERSVDRKRKWVELSLSLSLSLRADDSGEHETVQQWSGTGPTWSIDGTTDLHGALMGFHSANPPPPHHPPYVLTKPSKPLYVLTASGGHAPFFWGGGGRKAEWEREDCL